MQTGFLQQPNSLYQSDVTLRFLIKIFVQLDFSRVDQMMCSGLGCQPKNVLN
jgi:hypothetical protein